MIPIPEARKTLTHANCVVSTPVGYRPLQLDLHVPPGTAAEIVPSAEAVGFAEALRAQGVRCDVLPVEGAGHVFTGASVEVGSLTEAGADFLDEVL